MNDDVKIVLPFSQWKRVHFLGKINLDLEHPRLYRYECFSSFEKNYKKGRIVFPSPLSWPDLFEQRFLSDGFLKRCFGKQGHYNVFALCCTGDGYENADAQWNTRKLKKNDFCIRYSFNLWKFLVYLENKFHRNDFIDFYVSSISYDYSQDELMQNMHIKALEEAGIKGDIPYLIRAMSYKRKSFKYENEIRIWAIAKEGFDQKKEDKCLKMDLDWENIDLRVLVGPSKCDMNFKCYNKLVDYNRDKRKRENAIQQERKDKIVRELGVSKNKVDVTHLYDIPLWKSSKNLPK